MKQTNRQMVSRVALSTLCGTVLLLGACKKNDANTSSTSTDSSTMMTPAPANTAAAANNMPASGGMANKMTDAQIFARLAAANQGEIDAGKMAESKATNATVKAFGRQMVMDHGKMLSDGNALAKKLNITPDTTAADSIRNANAMMASNLKAVAKGTSFDSAYVNGQVMGHQATLDMVKNAEGQAQNAQLKAALQGAEPAIQHHLDQIKDIQGKMK